MCKQETTASKNREQQEMNFHSFPFNSPVISNAMPQHFIFVTWHVLTSHLQNKNKSAVKATAFSLKNLLVK
jgi:hypothetical protein